MYKSISEFLGTEEQRQHIQQQHVAEQYVKTQKGKGPQHSDPKVWGPHFWYTLHVSAANYPIEASPIVRERMKARILAIPYEVPCSTCRPHALAFIEANRDKLDYIVSGRDALSNFYVDFHNQVNKRYNKPEWSYEKAKSFYSD